MKKNNAGKLGICLIAQLILVLILIIVLLLSIFWNFLLPVAEVLAGITLIVMGINNHNIYKRKLLTWVYIIFGILVILSSGWHYFYG